MMKSKGQEIVRALVDNWPQRGSWRDDLAARIDAAIGEAEAGAREGCMLECSEDEVVAKAVAEEREACIATYEANANRDPHVIVAAIRARKP